MDGCMAVKSDTAGAQGLRIQPSNTHAFPQFRKRIDSDVTKLSSCWHGGEPIEAPDREYDWARLYDGPLTDTACVMFAVDTQHQSAKPDGLITTVVTEDMVDEYSYR